MHAYHVSDGELRACGSWLLGYTHRNSCCLEVIDQTEYPVMCCGKNNHSKVVLGYGSTFVNFETDFGCRMSEDTYS